LATRCHGFIAGAVGAAHGQPTAQGSGLAMVVTQLFDQLAEHGLKKD
jgi:hypothetical protein